MPEYGALVFIASDTSQNRRFSFVDRDLVTERMVVLNTGNVGIGTTAPTERLHVVGNLFVSGNIYCSLLPADTIQARERLNGFAGGNLIGLPVRCSMRKKCTN